MPTVSLAPASASRRRLAITLLALALLLLTLVSAGPPQASAATTVPACVETEVGAQPPAGALSLSGSREAALAAGRTVVLYDSFQRLPGDSLDPDDQYPPVCATRLVGGQPTSAWAFCTDRYKHVCLEQDVLNTVTGNPKFSAATDPLGPDKEKVIAYLAQNRFTIRAPSSGEMAGVPQSGQNTGDERTSAQQLIWCVAEAGPNHKTVTTGVFGTQTCAPNFTDADFDAILALVPDRPALAVTARESAPVQVGETAHFDVTTNVLGQPLTLAVSGAEGLKVCEGTATLSNGQLTVPGNDGFETKKVTLCATATAPGSAALTATVTHPSPKGLTWEWGGDDDCQVFATFQDVPSEPLSARAAVSFVAAPTTPEVPTTPNTPTTPGTPTQPSGPTTPIVTAKPKLGLTKTSDRRSARAGQRISYRIRLTNPSKTTTVRNVTVCDTLPAGLAFVRASPKAKLTKGRYCWTVASLAPGKSTQFTLTVRVLGGAAKQVTNRVTATSADAQRATASRSVRIATTAVRAGGVTG